MKHKRCIKVLVLLFLLQPFIMCSNSDMGNLNEIRPAPEYSLFNMLDDYPALHDSLSDVNPYEFNDQLADLINNDKETTIEFFRLFHTLILKENGDRGSLLFALDDIRGILDGIINQDNYDDEPEGNYSAEFFSFMDKFTSTDTQVLSNTFSLLNKVIEYIDDTYDDYTIDQVADDLIFFLQEKDGDQNVASFLLKMNEGIGKLFIRSNKYESEDLHIGNGVDGIDKIVSSFQNIVYTEKSSGREKIFETIRELGNLTAVKIDSKNFGDILHDFGVNASEHFDSNSTDPDYQNSNPYVNASIKESIKELYPGLIGLFLRSDREGSIIKDNGEGTYPLEIMSRELNRLNFKISEMDLERSLYDMIRYDGHGKDRLNSGSGANGFTFLEHFLFNLMNATYVGYLTRMSDSGEPHSNYNRGHGKATGGILTVNDCLYSVGTGEYSVINLINFNAYQLALNNRKKQGDNIFRSHEPFTNGGGNNFYLGYDYPVCALLSGQCAGDAGIPNGGYGALVPDDNETDGHDYKSYFTKVPNGIGELNTSRYLLGWVARVCWEGEGPFYATEGATIEGNTYTYYSPNGKIYARITKKGPEPSDWIYEYPTSETDSTERPTRYKERWHTDYFQIRVGGKYYSPGRVAGTTGNDRFKLNGADTPNAGALYYTESIPEASLERICATQEEAMYKNLQWFLTEKKFVFFIPLQIDLLTEQVASFVIIEANGAQGLTEARRGSANNHWVQGGEGTESECHGIVATNGQSPDYGNSTRPGDARITIIMREDPTGDGSIIDFFSIDLGVIWNDILGDGHVMPDIVGVNLGPVLRMGFIQEDTVPSADAGPTGAAWENRNRLLPLIVTLVGILHERSHYESPSDPNDHNYNYNGNHSYPIKYITNSILPALIKPMFRRYSDDGGRWVPRIESAPGGEDSNNFLARMGTSGIDHRPKGSLMTIAGLLSESDRFKGDGLLPAISKTELITRIVELIHGLGDPRYDDLPNLDIHNPETWGARRNFFYGLEQVLTTIRTPKGDAFERGYLDASEYPEWIFSENISEEIAGRTLDLDIILEEVLGSYETDGNGLAGFIYRREHSTEPDPWGNYNRFMKALPELLSNKGETAGKYNIMESFITYIDELFVKFEATDDEHRGLRHTIGAILYRHKDGKWESAKELTNLITKRFPETYDAYRKNGGSASKFFSFAKVLLNDNGFVQYLTDVMGTDHSTEDVMVQLYNFLGSDIIYYPDPFWNDLADILYFSSECMEKEEQNSSSISSLGNPVLDYMSPYSNINENTEETEYKSEFDPYTTLGKLLSR